MSLISAIYHSTLKRTSTFFVAIVFGAYVFERTFDQGADALYESLNKGKLWKHIRDKYETTEE